MYPCTHKHMRRHHRARSSFLRFQKTDWHVDVSKASTDVSPHERQQARNERRGRSSVKVRCVHGRDVTPDRAEAREARRCDLSENASLFEFSLCLSRACLDKMIIVSIKWRKSAFSDLVSAVGPLASHVKRTAVAALPGCIVDVRPTQAVVVALHKDACSSSSSSSSSSSDSRRCVRLEAKHL